MLRPKSLPSIRGDAEASSLELEFPVRPPLPCGSVHRCRGAPPPPPPQHAATFRGRANREDLLRPVPSLLERCGRSEDLFRKFGWAGSKKPPVGVVLKKMQKPLGARQQADVAKLRAAEVHRRGGFDARPVPSWNFRFNGNGAGIGGAVAYLGDGGASGTGSHDANTAVITPVGSRKASRQPAVEPTGDAAAPKASTATVTTPVGSRKGPQQPPAELTADSRKASHQPAVEPTGDVAASEISASVVTTPPGSRRASHQRAVEPTGDAAASKVSAGELSQASLSSCPNFNSPADSKASAGVEVTVADEDSHSDLE